METPQIVLCTMGTRGDIAPFIAIAAALVARGLPVTVLTNANWEPLVRGCGARFVAIAPQDPTQSGRDNFGFFLANVLPSFRASFDAIAHLRARHPRVLVVYKLGMFGAQCAAERFRLPNVKIALQPAVVRSVERPTWPLTVLAQGRWKFFTKPLLPLLFMLRESYGRYRRHTNQFRRSIGLAPDRIGVVRRVEDFTVMMCPRWFALPQSDWLGRFHFAGFPFAPAEPLDAGLAGFIATHGAPLVFTPGTGVTDTRAFFDAAARVCAELDLPGIFLSQDAHGAGPRILTRAFADLGALLPRCRMLIHHGGIGTTAQAVRAGIPQLVVPGGFDQPDNAMRIATLRLGAAALAKKPRAADWLALIRLALADRALRDRLEIASRDVRAGDAGAFTAALIARLASDGSCERAARAASGARGVAVAQVFPYEPT